MTDNGKKKRPAPDELMYPEPAVDGMTEEKAMARAALDPATKATGLVKGFSAVPTEQLHSTELVQELIDIGRKARGGDLGGIEAMLAAQAYSLDGIFFSLAMRAKNNLNEYPRAAEMFMRMALKAQSQCRATAETLALMKNPMPTIRQANIAGQMQVNNGAGVVQKSGRLEGTPAAQSADNAIPKSLGHSEPQVLDALCAHAQAREISTDGNELLSGGQHEAVDYRRTAAAGGADPHLAALEKGDRRND